MATIDSEITSARYDLKDEYATQYSDAMLLDFYNRALKNLDAFLGAIKSDWVLESTTVTLSSGDTSVPVPADFMTERKLRYNNNDLHKRNAQQCLEWQQEYSAGTPNYYAPHQGTFIFDREAGADYTIHVYYNKASSTLATGGSMPFSDEFNDVLKQAAVMIAKTRNQYDITRNYGLYNFFSQALGQKVVSRNRSGMKGLGY